MPVDLDDVADILSTEPDYFVAGSGSSGLTKAPSAPEDVCCLPEE
jgi:hypothetical protein